MKKNAILYSILLLCNISLAQKYEGLALTPLMGWISATHWYRLTADIIISSGMKDAGYTYLVLDDGWMTKERDPRTGDLIPDPKKFPNGMKILIDYVHSRGLKFGLYNCAGTKTCAGYPGTRGYEYQDARFYASLGIDYLKFDWCSSQGQNAKESYTTMSKALKAAGRPIVFSLCEWGSNKPWEWAENVGQLWRTTGDISNLFDSYIDHGRWKQLGVMPIADMQSDLRKYAGPGHWNDPDMLEVGNGMSTGEDRAHFSLWCILAAPLMAGNDLRKMSRETDAILTNKEVIAVNQDPMGVEGYRYRVQDSLETWVKPLSDGDWAVCFLNRSGVAKPLEYNWKNEIINDTLSRQQLNANETTYSIRNLWAKMSAGTTKNPFKTTIPSHDVVMLRLGKMK
ncbi:MAG: glycoside hydrolase family 27 protein [Bacteroidota bacterium]|nr:glycoside hydrolase family 27 protein [Bacteroidota bacterium]